MRRTSKVLLAVAVAAGLFAVGRWSAGGAAEDMVDEHAGHDGEAGTSEEVAEAEPEIWTCPMHAQIKLPDPGDCPICGMDLVLLEADAAGGPRQLVMSPAAVELAQIAVAPVVRSNVTRPVRMTGKVAYDETAVRTISAWVPGRLDRLFVDYTGVRVAKGDHLVDLYSPDLLNAQEELLSAHARLAATEGEVSGFLAKSNERSYQTAREKLVLYGLTEAQVDEIERRGSPEDHVMISSPTSGIVIEKRLDQGAYVQTGTPIYRIADLSSLWVQMDAYEQDLPWIRYGQRVLLEVEALPGRSIEGTVAYIDPFVHEHTRTARVRVNVDNSAGALKPGMFVRASALARLGAGGRVLDRELAGKWVSPMHPEIVKDGPGVCDVCGMDLVRAEDMGLVGDEGPGGARPLVVPTSAVLVTGRRAVAYVEVPGAERPTFEGREVVLGPRAGDQYIVLEGLEQGERVVVNGAFRIDSSMQIMAKPSMMQMEAQKSVASGPQAVAFRVSLDDLLHAYLELQVALAADENERALEAFVEVGQAAAAPSAAGLGAELRGLWREEVDTINRGVAAASSAAGIEELRAAFEDLSVAVTAVVDSFGHDLEFTLNEVYCPMAFDNRGAGWIQQGDSVANPYFGASMLRCGDVRASFGPVGGSSSGQTQGGGHDHGDHSQQPDQPVDHSAHDHAAMEQATDDSDGATAAVAATTAGPELAAVLEAYLVLQVDLAADQADASASSAAALARAVVTARGVDGQPAAVAAGLERMAAALDGLEGETDIERLRGQFQPLSNELLAILETTGNPLGVSVSKAHCPMAFDFTGADWIQAEETLANPYFGASMLRCGSIVQTWSVD